MKNGWDFLLLRKLLKVFSGDILVCSNPDRRKKVSHISNYKDTLQYKNVKGIPVKKIALTLEYVSFEVLQIPSCLADLCIQEILARPARMREFQFHGFAPRISFQMKTQYRLLEFRNVTFHGAGRR
jgi:hypothetical protein